MIPLSGVEERYESRVKRTHIDKGGSADFITVIHETNLFYYRLKKLDAFPEKNPRTGKRELKKN